MTLTPHLNYDLCLMICQLEPLGKEGNLHPESAIARCWALVKAEHCSVEAL